METLKEILIGDVSADVKQTALNFVGMNPDRIDVLWQWLNFENDPLKWRACWVFEEICIKHQEVKDNYIHKIATLYPKLEHKPLRRMLGHILAETIIPEKYESDVLNTAFNWLQDPAQPIAVRVHAMQIVYNLSMKYPELQQELQATLHHLYDTGSAGFRNRAGKILAKIEQNPKNQLC